MKYLILIANAVILFVITNPWSTVHAQQMENFLSNLKMGEWIEFEGAPQADYTILINEIQILRDRTEDDDWEVSGAVTRVAPEEQTIYILHLPIKFDSNTGYDDSLNIIKSFPDIKPGMTVRVKGQYTMDGVFLAYGIESAEFKETEKNLVKWTGKVEGVEQVTNSVNILGHVITLTPETRIKSINQE